MSETVAEYFDADDDGRIALNEIAAGVDSLRLCCGTQCPFINKCNDRYQQRYLQTSSANTTISTTEFVDRIVEFEDTVLVPTCTQRAIFLPQVC
jgi:hypothetical protein